MWGGCGISRVPATAVSWQALFFIIIYLFETQDPALWSYLDHAYCVVSSASKCQVLLQSGGAQSFDSSL